MRVLQRIAAALAMTTLAGCGGAGASTGPGSERSSSPVLTSIVVELPTMAIQVGESLTARVTGRDQFGAAMDIADPAWSTGAPSVASVSPTGVVTALSSGQTQVVATVNGKDGRATITVLEVPVARVDITPTTTAILLGSSRQLVATVVDGNGRLLADRPVAWSSSDSAKATVSPAGIITGLQTGTVSVTASVGGKSATSVVSVAAPGALATIEVSARRANIVVGDTLQLTAVLRDVEGGILTGREVSWVATVAAGQGVATVSATGLVTATSAGTVVVEAESGGQRGALAIVVRENVDESMVVTFAEPLPNEVIGDTLRVVVTVRSARPLRDVVATVDVKRSVLAAEPVGFTGVQVKWVGTIDVSDMKFGPYLVTVTATDDAGAIGVAAIVYQRDTRKGEVGGKLPPKNK